MVKKINESKITVKRAEQFNSKYNELMKLLSKLCVTLSKLNSKEKERFIIRDTEYTGYEDNEYIIKSFSGDNLGFEILILITDDMWQQSWDLYWSDFITDKNGWHFENEEALITKPYVPKLDEVLATTGLSWVEDSVKIISNLIREYE